MCRVILRPWAITSIVAAPTAAAVALPPPSTVTTKGFVLDQSGIPPDGGTPSPRSTTTENTNVSRTRIVAIAGRSCTEITGARADCCGATEGVGPLGVRLQLVEPTTTRALSAYKIHRIVSAFEILIRIPAARSYPCVSADGSVSVCDRCNFVPHERALPVACLRGSEPPQAARNQHTHENQHQRHQDERQLPTSSGLECLS